MEEYGVFSDSWRILTWIGSSSPSSSTHLKNFPPKNCTPMIEKISQKTRHTRSTLKIDGIAYINAFTTILMPCHRDIARSGRRARNVLSERSTFKFSFSSISNEKTDTCGREAETKKREKTGCEEKKRERVPYRIRLNISQLCCLDRVRNK